MPHRPSPLHPFPRPPRGRPHPLRPRSVRAVAAGCAALLPITAFGAIGDALGSQGTWAILAALGLLAVVIAALTVTRSRPDARDDGSGAAPSRRDPAGPPPSDFAPGVDVAPPAVAPAADARAVEAADFALALPAAIRTRRAGDPRHAIAAPPCSVPGDDGATDGRRAAGPATHAAAAESAAPTAPAARVPSAPPAAGDASPLFLALHHVDLSIDVLRRHLAAEPRPMPAVWVMLLDLCRTHGREQAFREIAAEFHARFNVRTPAWESYPPDRSEPGLEAYPRIVRELTQSWGTHECRRLLDRLLYDTRNGERRGFTINAYNDLIALRRAADAVLDSIDQDLAEESKVREAFAQAAVDAANDDSVHEPPAPSPSPLVGDLERTLDDDLREAAARSALEHEHPALAEALVREWGNAALAGRLCEMLARGRDGAPALTGESRDDVELLRSMAERLADGRRITLAAD